MVVSLKANRKKIIAFLILAVVVAGACIFLKLGKSEEPEEIPGGTNEERVAFLQSFGWEVDENAAETREVMIPAQFSDVYTTYNVMQKAQGFDLKPYAGMICTQYKYKINNYPNETEVYATLLVYGEVIIGGDVACSEMNGFMHGFAPDSASYGETKGSDKKKSADKTDKKNSESSNVDETTETQDAAAEDAESEQNSDTDTEDTGGEVTSQDDVEDTAAVPEDAYPTD